jgi:putative phosphoesterase
VPVRVLVLADTHVRADRRRTLPDEVWAAAHEADLILHAGDVVTPSLLEELDAHAPVHAVLGNNDVDLRGSLAETVELELDGVGVAMVHDAGPRRGREARLHRRFPTADVVIFGHSHLPEDAPGVDGQRIFNPGSCTERRRAPARSYGLLELAAATVVDHRIVWLDDQASARRVARHRRSP